MLAKSRKKKSKKKTDRVGKYDWPKIRKEWIACDEVNLKKWAEKKGIPYSTARANLSVTEKKTKQKRTNEEVLDFRKKLTDAGKGEKEQVYNRALKQSIALLEEILVEAGVEFRTALAYRHAFKGPAEIGRLAIQAAGELRQVAIEYQGIPTDEEDFSWPLTRKFWPYPYQRDFIFDLPADLLRRGIDSFIFAFIGGIRSGKTRCGAEKFAYLAWKNRGSVLGVYSPTYRMLEDSTKSTFLEVLNNKGISYIHQKSDNSIVLFGDTKIIFRSLEKPDRLRGPTLAAAWMDEVGQMKTREGYDIVYGRVSDPDAVEPCMLITTTPDGLGWLYNVVVEEAIKNKVRLYHARTDQNTALEENYVERLKGVYDSRFAKQELEGEFINVFVGQAYWNFSREANVIPEGRIPYDKHLPLVLAFDLNIDPMCWNIGQKHTKGSEYFDVFFDEIHMRTASTEEAAREFVRRYKGHKGGVLVHGDATARHGQTVTSRTDYEVICEIIGDALPGVEMRVGRGNPQVTDRILAVNARLKDAKGARKLFLVKEKCPETIKDFEQVAFKPGTRDLAKSDGERTHHTDAIGYYINREYPIRKIKRRAA